MRLITKHLSICLACLALASQVMADPVWHCSRNKVNEGFVHTKISSEDQFSLASFNSSSEVIGVSVRDLIDIYRGIAVYVGGIPLSACFFTGNNSLTSSALTSLGLSAESAHALSRKSSIVQNNLHLVYDERQMLSCIANNFPAVGYISSATQTDSVLPCF